MRIVLSVLSLCLFVSATCFAQTPSRAAIGKTLADDSDMYKRYVFTDSQTVDKNVSLSLPVMPDEDIQNWLIDHMAQIMSVTPTLYPTHKAKIVNAFTPAGWEQLERQWQQAKIPELVLQQDYSMTAMVMTPPFVVAKGRQSGQPNAAYRWIVDVPVLLTYTAKTGESQAYQMALRIGVTRIAMREDGQLIAIDQWAVAPPKPVTDTPAATP